MRVVYRDGQSSIWGGGTRWWSYRKRRHRKSRDWKYFLRMPGSDVTGSEGSRPFFRFPALFSYYSSSTKCSTVVQVAWLPDVTWSKVTSVTWPRKGFPWKGVRMRNRKLGGVFTALFSGCFRIFSRFFVVLCSTPRPRSHCVVFLRFKWMKWYRNSHCCMYNEICKLHCL